MYNNNRPFTREQLVFIIEAAMAAASDKVQGCMPTCQRDLELWKAPYISDEMANFIHGVMSHVGIFVPILWAQTEGKRIDDGMGTQEFEGWDEFDQRLNSYVSLVYNEHHFDLKPPNWRSLAERIVDAHWADYLDTYWGDNLIASSKTKLVAVKNEDGAILAVLHAKDILIRETNGVKVEIA